ncbi:MAG: DM13 domain-containing protein [Candidatus Limnocylindria bacterium]
MTIATGQLGYVDALHNGKGEVRLIQAGSERVLRFENVAITNAPDVHVYLSSDTGGSYVPANSVELGTLKATNGSFNYAIPADLDLGRFRSVVVWCRAFSVLVTWADLIR